jgi:hypothetical protein
VVQARFRGLADLENPSTDVRRRVGLAGASRRDKNAPEAVPSPFVATVTTLVLVGLSFALVFVSFVGGRLLAGWAFGVADRIPPFGEALPSGFERALPGARLAITLVGPLAIYAFAVLLCVAAFALGARVGPGTTIERVMSASPAAADGLLEGDRGLGDAIRRGGTLPAELLIRAIESTFKRDANQPAGPFAFVVATARLPGYGDRLLMLGSGATAGMLVFCLASLALWPPRTSRRADPSPADRLIPVVDDANGPARPGVRFTARAIDWLLIWIAVGLLAPRLLVLTPLIWCPIEAWLLSRWGFTPGKWLLGIAVRDQEGRRPTFHDAFRRAAAVWTYGAGAYTPFGLATAVMAYAQVKRKVPAYWDTLGGYEVHHRPVGAARAVTAVVFLGVAVAILRGARLW